MGFLRLAGAYFIWHYSAAFVDIVRILKDLLWFIYHFFSLPLLFSTWFSPWKRIEEEQAHTGFDIGNFFSALLVNVIMRLVGFLMRSTLIIAGALSLVLGSALGILFLVVWFFLPPIIIIISLKGIILLL
ncbi:MAG: hypothetical protein BMS9Abin13_554 [Patescibacteria group bacterium]|nr:MAG: hypothetical protein BMS9Abin13_554 [Patescibacteria group bacterium]